MDVPVWGHGPYFYVHATLFVILALLWLAADIYIIYNIL